VVRFNPITYTVDEGVTANLRIELIGEYAIDVSVQMNTEDDEAFCECTCNESIGSFLTILFL
jgi:head-tail adaptor